MNKISIQEIIKGCCNKQPKYQRLFVDKYAGFLYAICIRYMNDKEIARDQLQIGLFKMLDKMKGFDANKGKIESWISTIMINTCLSELRKNKLHLLPITDETINTSFMDADIIDDMNTEEILKLVRSLPKIYREIFNLIVIDGYSHSDAANLLEIKVGSSRSRLARAKEMLRLELLKTGLISREEGNFYIKNGQR